MSSLASGISVALRALMANQQAIEVTEHNVANASVRGYRRQVAVMNADLSYSTGEFNSGTGNGLMGGGVAVDRIMRYTSEFFDGRYRQEVSSQKNWDMQRDGLKQLESMLGENAASGVIPTLDEFWGSWQRVASDPANIGNRQALVDQAATLSASLRSRYETIGSLRAEQNQGIIQRVDEINTIATQVAALNENISSVIGHGEQPNDMLDDRDRLLDRLSELSGAVSFAQSNGEVLVSIGGQVLVSNHTVYALKTTPKTGDTAVVSIVNSNNAAVKIPNGELAGMLEVRDTALLQQRNQLDNVATALMNAVNGAHSGGVDMNGDPAVDFFTGTDASDIQVNTALLNDPRLVAAAALAGDSGDGSVASTIARLASAPQAALGNQTLSKYYNQKVTSLGLDTQRAVYNSSQHKSAVTALDAQRESVSGVNLDEEAANMVRYQRAYEAATRLMTAVDEMLSKVINEMGLVGR